MEESKEEAQHLTPEQIAERKKELLKYYSEEIPFLEKQREYEMLTAEIDEAHLRKVMVQYKLSQLLAPPPGEPGNTGKTDESKTERKLKKVE